MEQRWRLAALAEMTGGFAVANTNNYGRAFERLVRENGVFMWFSSFSPTCQV